VSVAADALGMGDGPRTPAQRAGDAAEDLVATRLAAAGWTILGRDLHVGRNELDIVAVDPGPPRALVIVEVRWRSRRDYGLAEETVDHRKRLRVRQAAYALLERGELPHLPLRFDLVVVEPGERGGEPRVRHHRAAF
jgi:putative endonuclease